MSIEERLLATFGPADDLEKVPEEVIESYRGRLAGELLSIWRNIGWCSFAGGGFWIVDPRLYDETVAEWLPPWHADPKGPPLVFARSGLGDLLMLHDDEVGCLLVHHGHYMNIGSPLERFLEYYLDEDYESSGLSGRLTRKAAKKLGPLAADEMFTFVPALALGGEEELENMQKVKIFPHLSFLAQLFDEVTIE